MWNSGKKLLFALSLGLNAAFIAIWLMHAAPGFMAERQHVKTSGENGLDLLHKKIGVTAEQWQQIEPGIQEFRKKAQARQQAIGKLRSELMELLAAPGVDEKTIRAKQDEILAEKRQMQNLVIELLLLEKKVLKPAQQRALLAEIHRLCSCGESGRKGGSGLAPVMNGRGAVFSVEADGK
ncbi:MAG TPA: periplasmic heavy metal sensor [Desulfosalsimonadaceae bacterium]|nr:periplasmic heavy metal sensor [Desulfosalsimonadaceae bacterium]